MPLFCFAIVAIAASSLSLHITHISFDQMMLNRATALSDFITPHAYKSYVDWHLEPPNVEGEPNCFTIPFDFSNASAYDIGARATREWRRRFNGFDQRVNRFKCMHDNRIQFFLCVDVDLRELSLFFKSNHDHAALIFCMCIHAVIDGWPSACTRYSGSFGSRTPRDSGSDARCTSSNKDRCGRGTRE